MIPIFSRMFPGTNLQDLNLDWICRMIMELSKGIIAPWINQENKHWMVYDTELEQFVDSGVNAAPMGDLPTGGTAGQILTKLSAADYDAGWSEPAETGAKTLVLNNVRLQNPDSSTPVGQLADITNAQITANYYVSNIQVSNPNALYTNLTWQTSAGHCIISGELTASPITATVFLVEQI